MIHSPQDVLREIYYVKPVNNYRLVPVADPREPRRYLSVTLVGALLLGAMLFSAWQRFAGVQAGYRLEMLQQEKQQLLEANRKLRLEEASLGDPVRIDRIARDQLGMATLSPRQIWNEEAAGAGSAAPVLAQVQQQPEPLPPQPKQVALAVP